MNASVHGVDATDAVSVYVHFPYCLKKCPYCDFNSFAAARSEIDHVGYADAVLRELEARLQGGGLGDRQLRSIFFGGGTPSLWQAEQLGRVVRAILAAFPAAKSEVEITAECNPTSLDALQVDALMAAGINRFSVGVQSLSDERLRYLGRLHDRRLALQALRNARARCDRVSADFMFGLPGLEPDTFVAELGEVLALGIQHVSAYALTIESGTQFGALAKKGRLPIASDDAFADTYLATEAFLSQHGFAHYEVSNYAHPGQASQHNAHYWAAGDYFGLGAGAVGCLRSSPDRNDTKLRWRSHSAVSRYVEAKGAAEDFSEWQETLSFVDQLNEKLMLGLRTERGAALSMAERRLLEGSLSTRAQQHFSRGALHWGDGDNTLYAARSAWLQLDALVAELFVGSDRR